MPRPTRSCCPTPPPSTQSAVPDLLAPDRRRTSARRAGQRHSATSPPRSARRRGSPTSGCARGRSRPRRRRSRCENPYANPRPFDAATIRAILEAACSEGPRRTDSAEQPIRREESDDQPRRNFLKTAAATGLAGRRTALPMPAIAQGAQDQARLCQPADRAARRLSPRATPSYIDRLPRRPEARPRTSRSSSRTASPTRTAPPRWRRN